MDIEILTCSNCEEILEEEDHIELGCYKCPSCGKIVDAELEVY